jgi:hypothetical protein
MREADIARAQQQAADAHQAASDAEQLANDIQRAVDTYAADSDIDPGGESEGDFPETVASAPAASLASIAALLQHPDTDMAAAENAPYRDDPCPICMDDLISATVE